MPQRVPFVVDVNRSTLEQLDDLLAEVSDGMDAPSDWPPPQEQECMTVAALNLLNLQVSARMWSVTEKRFTKSQA